MSKRRPLTVENLECRRVLTASLGWDGAGAGSAELTYHISNAPANLSQAEVNAAIETALDAWSEVVDVSFTPTAQAGLPDSLDFSFRNLDGRGGTLAQAYFPDDVNPPRIAGDVQFDLSDPWEVGNAQGRAAFDLVAVAVHEIGHSLGLEHIHEAGSILQPTISPNTQFTGLSDHDVEAIQSLYAPAADAVNPGSELVPELDHDHNHDHDDLDLSDSGIPTPNENPWNRWRWSFQIGGFRLGGFVVRFGGFGGLGAETSSLHNARRPTDVNQDSTTSAVDALLIINAINSGTNAADMVHMCDTNDDGEVSPVDALLVVNALNEPTAMVTEFPEETTTPPTDLPSDTRLPEAEDNEPDDSELDPNIEQPPAVDPQETDDPDEDEADDGDIDDMLDDEAHDECPTPLFAGLGLGVGGRFHRVPGGISSSAVDSLFANFDDNDDQALEEDEVPGFAWSYLMEQGVDGDQDGRITLEEIHEAIDARKLERFNQLDDDQDGRLTESELSERSWDRIRNADTDQDGGVTFDELKIFQQLTPFERLDANGDGQITVDEVSEQRWERLLRRDTNDDQAITEDELERRPQLERRLSRLGELASRVFRFVSRFR